MFKKLLAPIAVIGLFGGGAALLPAMAQPESTEVCCDCCNVCNCDDCICCVCDDGDDCPADCCATCCAD